MTEAIPAISALAPQGRQDRYRTLINEGYREDQFLTCNSQAALTYRGAYIEGAVDTCTVWCPHHNLICKGAKEIQAHFGRLPTRYRS